jgi:FADH2 O2-dependent halogenase
MNKRFNVAIIGSGFSGSILAWILASQGRSVALIDPVSHPRSAIGESSTPIADLLLRRLGERYGLKQLQQLSTYGDWQAHHPQLACGRKRGFSYYVHQPGQPFSDTPTHDRSLLVAASASDEVADTHWYRRDVDQYFCQQAIASGAESFAGQRVEGMCPGDPNHLRLSSQSDITADWVIDASGQATVMARLLEERDHVKTMSTNTRCAFGHFRGVRSWLDVLHQADINCQKDPFNADDSAQHHLHAEGWMWMLRFNNGITSVGWTGSNEVLDAQITAGYPSIDSMLANAELVWPAGGPAKTNRLQRLYHPLAAPRCLMMPTTACTIDPLHSTGIAHGLAGVQRIANIVLGDQDGDQYDASVWQEARLLDRLVSTAYQAMHDFPRFTAACMLYFAAAIACEERILAGESPTHLWNADDDRFVTVVNTCCDLLNGENSTAAAIDQVRREIQPWNSTGLMDPNVNQRYAYTATKT